MASGASGGALRPARLEAGRRRREGGERDRHPGGRCADAQRRAGQRRAGAAGGADAAPVLMARVVGGSVVIGGVVVGRRVIGRAVMSRGVKGCLVRMPSARGSGFGTVAMARRVGHGRVRHAMAALPRVRAGHRRRHRAPDGEQHGKQDQEAEAKQLHGGKANRADPGSPWHRHSDPPLEQADRHARPCPSGKVKRRPGISAMRARPLRRMLRLAERGLYDAAHAFLPPPPPVALTRPACRGAARRPGGGRPARAWRGLPACVQAQDRTSLSPAIRSSTLSRTS